MLPSWPPAPISSRRLDGQRSFTDELQPHWVSTHARCMCARRCTTRRAVAPRQQNRIFFLRLKRKTTHEKQYECWTRKSLRRRRATQTAAGTSPVESRRETPAVATANKLAVFTALPWIIAIAVPLGGDKGSRGRGGRPGFAPSYAPMEPEPLPLNEDANSRIFAFVDDLFFQAKIQETARKLNVKVEFVKNEKDMLERIKQNGEEKPSLVIFDMNNANAKPLTLIPKLKSKLKKTSIIGFLSHVQGDLKQKAHEVGCDMVLPRSAFSQNLPQLLRRHGAPEDEAAAE